MDGADAVNSWAPAGQRAGNVVKAMPNGRINPASLPLGYLDDHYGNAGTKYLAIHPAAFQAEVDEHRVYDNYMCRRGSTGNPYSRAPVFLPHGATVTGLWAYYYDTDAGAGEDVKVWLNRVNHTGGWNSMAECQSTGGPGWSSCSDTTINNPVIDNWIYTYQVTVMLPRTCSEGAPHRLSAVVIGYTES